MNIVSIASAQGWYAKFATDEGEEQDIRPLAFWAIDPSGGVLGAVVVGDEVLNTLDEAFDGSFEEYVHEDDIEFDFECDDEDKVFIGHSGAYAPGE